MELIHPSSTFVKNAIAAIQRDDDLAIKVFPGREGKRISALLPGLINADMGCDNEQNDWRYIIRMLLMLRFFSVFFYAKSGGYRTSFIAEDGHLLITMSQTR